LRIELAVRLGSRPPHRRTLPAVENPELDAADVSDTAHQAVERIDFPDQMALPEPANRRIARHGADRCESMRDQCRLRAHTRRRGRGFTAGVAAANHNDVESMCHQNLECRVLAEDRGGVKISGFNENVSRETSRGVRKCIHPGCPF